MLICIPDVLDRAQVAQIRAAILATTWEDGRLSAGTQSGGVKVNRQVPISSQVGAAAGDSIIDALGRSLLFLSAALPLRILPPMFNRYASNETFGAHVDNAIRRVPGSPVHLRTDLSGTLFLTDPEDYDGGELTIETSYGAQQVKLPAGHLVLYPATSLHLVTPVTRGERVSSFFWVQSMIRDAERRTILFDLDQSVQRLRAERGEDETSVKLAGVYHNLIRQWAET
ncbi:MAG: Fe2+-dependent dioxygenase [Hyphomicrobiales bacterium]|nr:Fe2+-dependent dioxygenase [Hyphomicrobiales bacterium]